MPDQQVSQFVTQEPKVFDFEQAVADARRDFPKETKDITFIDTSAPDAFEKLTEWAKMAGLSPTQYNDMMDNAENMNALTKNANGYKLVAMPAKREGANESFSGDSYKSAYFCFQHELGHFVVPQAHASDTSAVRKTTQWREHAADTFAMLRGLKDGVFQKKDLIDLSDKRGHSMLLTEDVTHLTSMSLDALAINPKNTDFISLSKKEIIQISKAHAEEFQIEGKMNSRFVTLQMNGRRAYQAGATDDEVVQGKMRELQEIAMSSPKDSQEFYVAARILNNVLETGVLKSGGIEQKVDVSTEEWKEAKKALMEKAGDRDIGAKKASQTVSLTRPEKPKNFVSKIADSFKPIKI
ncbi:MAG: hypothetical protein PSY14_01345 [bacterium]|nr:hypothetical protein [bacterium]